MPCDLPDSQLPCMLAPLSYPPVLQPLLLYMLVRVQAWILQPTQSDACLQMLWNVTCAWCPRPGLSQGPLCRWNSVGGL